MSTSILVDTDVMIDFLRGDAKAAALLRGAGAVILSSISVAELYVGVKGEAEQQALDQLVSLFQVVPVTVEIAKAGGQLRRDFGPSHGVGLADAIVAATAQAENAELKTLNVKHFPMLAGLKPAYLKS